MMKKLLSVLLALTMVLCLAPTAALAAEGDIEINEANFPDSTFRAYVKENFDTDGNDTLSTSELAAVTSIKCSYKGISDLTGIEYFTSLTELWCQSNQLTSLDLSNCPNLQILYCFNNQLTSLDVSDCANLSNLGCNYNQLTSLDTSENMGLKELSCSGNQLTSLDVSKNTNLTVLHCSTNQLTSLDVSKNTSLTRLFCYGNQLTSLDVSDCVKLQRLSCENNQLTSLDVSDCVKLLQLSCENNQLSSLDVSDCVKLLQLSCENNQLSSLDVSDCVDLENLYCENNQLTSLDVSDCVRLQLLDCSNNRLTLLDVSKNIELKALKCSNNQLTSLDLSVYSGGIMLISDDNSYAITATNGVFDLSTLPGSFDVSRASNWVGATEENGKLTITDPSKVTYTYDCRNGQSVTFTLAVTHMHDHAWSSDWSSDETAHWHECTAAWCPTADNSEKDGYAEHLGGTATCRDRAICDDCKQPYGALAPDNHTNLQHFPAKAATRDAEGNIEYWYCDGCGRYYSDKDGTTEIQKSDTVIEKLQDDPQKDKLSKLIKLVLRAVLICTVVVAVIGITAIKAIFKIIINHIM